MHIRAVLRCYWQFVRLYPKSQLGILFFYALGQLGAVVVSPLIYKWIIDIVSNPGPDMETRIMYMVAALAINIVLYNAFYRLADYLIIYAQNGVMMLLENYSLERLQRHSYKFFTNAFAGGLVAKTKRFIHAYETLQDQFTFQIWMGGLSLVLGIAVLFYHSVSLGLVYFVWLLLYLVLVFFMLRWQIPKSLARARADTKTTGHYADIITNALTVKMFGTRLREELDFKRSTLDQARARHAHWM